MAAPVLDTPAQLPSAGRTATLWVFRLLALAQAILFVLQPISIGSFLQGSWAAFDMHSIIGGVLVLPTMLTAGVGLLLAVLTRRLWVGLGSLALGVLTTSGPRHVQRCSSRSMATAGGTSCTATTSSTRTG